MEITLRQIYFSYPIFSKMFSQELPVKLAFKIGKTIKKFSDEYDLIEKQRTTLVAKYGEKTETGEVKVKQDLVGKFLSEFEEFLSEKTKIEIEKINLNSFPENFSISPQDMSSIDFLLEEGL